MRSGKLLLLALALMLGLTACGGSGEPSPEAVPAPEIVTPEAILADPFAAYFDLSGLSQTTLDLSLQDLDLTQEGISVTQTLCDGMLLYVAFDVTWPQGTDPAAEMVRAELTTGGGAWYEGMVTWTQTSDATGSYIASFPGSFQPSDALTLTIPVLGTDHVFNWTAEKVCPAQTADLTDSTGTVVGEAVLSPFSLRFTIDEAYVGGITHGDTIRLLDGTDSPLPETWATSGDPSAAFLEFFVPMEPGQVMSLQAGPYTAHF